MDPFIAFLLKVRNRHILIADIVAFTCTPLVALMLRTDGGDSIGPYWRPLLLVTVLFTVTKLAVFYFGGLYSRFWRYASLDELARIAVLGGLGLMSQTLLFFGALRPLGLVPSDFPRSIPILEGILAMMIAGGLRYCLPLSERIYQRHHGRDSGERVLIAGARSDGVAIVREMQREHRLGMIPVGFVDDDNEKQGMKIRGVPVLGRCKDIITISHETKASTVIIAMPLARGKLVRQIVIGCEQAGVKTKIMPGMHELLDGTASVKQLRDVDIEDLLRRDPVRTDIGAVSELIRGKRVLVTGAGGSIGSELCRQVLQFQPASIVLLGRGENSVFEIQGELLTMLSHAPFDGLQEAKPAIYPVIADIRAFDRLWAVFHEHQPEIVFHSAAHKHVPMMELNPAEAVTNNVLGTRNLLRVSQAFDVSNFIMMSTDKAINPTNVMGASKRIAELLVHQAARESGKPYVAVRFGNVLGSRGSVVNTFKRQIAAGGPVTVTHPDMVRYFMTIPEAVQLVLQAATLGRGGELFMLDMGEPVKVIDLAKDLISLSGLRAEHNIEIVFTGTRPGEKLYEEMFLPDEKYERTQHEKIFIAQNASSLVPAWLDLSIESLEEAAHRNDTSAIIRGLRNLVPEFNHGDTLTGVPDLTSTSGATEHAPQAVPQVPSLVRTKLSFS